jgi:hypothetical protein
VKEEAKHHASECMPDWGPRFWDFDIADRCNASAESWCDIFGQTYNNDTGLNGRTFFTGARHFQVKEIEVFQVTDEGFDRRIVSAISEAFSEFRGKKFSLLWRGTRDGFQVERFHERCDGHGNTLTVIQDGNGNIFGAFSPVSWESRKVDWRTLG